MPDKPRYRRVLLKISGEGLSKAGGFGIDEASLSATAGEIIPLVKMGVQVALVVGGGNFVRGRQYFNSQYIQRTTADTMGMLATTINALALQDRLEAGGVQARAMGTVSTPAVCEPFIRRKAIDHLEHGRVVILAGGTGSPFFTTDTCAALRAAELSAEVVLKATKVDGIFSEDPEKNPNAQRYSRLTYHEVLARELGVMDLTAVSMCMEQKIPVVVFKFTEPGNVIRVVCGQDVGTTITA